MSTTFPQNGSAIGRGLLAVGDRWTLLILQRAFVAHTRRFGDWRAQLGLSESTLAARLRGLVAAGLMERVPYDDNGRTRDEYLLTARALQLWSLLLAIWGWERISMPDVPNAPVLVHNDCGSAALPVLGCGVCGVSPVTARDTSAERGAKAEFAQIAVPRLHRRAQESSGPIDPLSYYPQTMEILGDRWSTAILAAAFLGVRRFTTFKTELGIAPSILSDRLRRFVAAGVLHAPSDEGEYRLTRRGMDFFPVYAILVDWALRSYPTHSAHDLVIRHASCAAPLRPILVCSHCGGELSRTSVHFTFSPAVS
ncbi:winged helix-turn-helix transcriptional regulator [Glaciibacter psychrotolerans]|uniref:DNA-binding HxlR family transcriptional regulator n=1 Tax=Glaciibacter psychrotolerans TaxID=670054 RepID=A0A7Z0EDX4_9MICO|nr:DNA-binding HxlR family transcriptional regulator [Leifsonia psychrotolerans]